MNDQDNVYGRNQDGSTAVLKRYALLILMLATSILYVRFHINNLIFASQTAEAYLIIFCLGISFYLSSTFEFWLGAVSALFGLVVTCSANNIVQHLGDHLETPFKKDINLITVFAGLTLAVLITKRYTSSSAFIVWSIVIQFLLLCIFQRDQFGADFSPYSYEIQWMPGFIFITLFILGLLRRAKNAAGGK